MAYTFLEHTADIGIEVNSNNFSEAFIEAIYGLLEIIFGKSFLTYSCDGAPELLEISSIDKESLLVDTLNEILFMIDARKTIPLKPKIDQISNNYVKLTFIPFQFDLNELPINLYVKAVTFHQLEIIEKENLSKIKFFIDI